RRHLVFLVPQDAVVVSDMTDDALFCHFQESQDLGLGRPLEERTAMAAERGGWNGRERVSTRPKNGCSNFES
ncbi:hypothetical protein, partial [Escherichia coli]|uniref:hypothetical protein n=1 Tax=Escherichia coli TaxID=562 RepID=UPI001C591AFD